MAKASRFSGMGNTDGRDEKEQAGTVCSLCSDINLGHKGGKT